jgi:hypothetical protein
MAGLPPAPRISAAPPARRHLDIPVVLYGFPISKT